MTKKKRKGLCRFNLKAGKALALGHTWSRATHAPRKGRKKEKKRKKKKKRKKRKKKGGEKKERN